VKPAPLQPVPYDANGQQA
jgi:hypothetical protein